MLKGCGEEDVDYGPQTVNKTWCWRKMKRALSDLDTLPSCSNPTQLVD